MKRTFWAVLGAAGLACFIGGAGAIGDNLVTNPHFDDLDVSDWHPITGNPVVTGSFAWSDQDAAGNPNSGSLEVKNTSTQAAGTRFDAEQCVNELPPQDDVRRYTISGTMHIPENQGIEGGVELLVAWYSGFDCMTQIGSLSQVDGTFLASTGGGWLMRSNVLDAPEGTLSFGLRLGVTKRGNLAVDPAVPFAGYFDDLGVGPVWDRATVPLLGRDD